MLRTKQPRTRPPGCVRLDFREGLVGFHLSPGEHTQGPARRKLEAVKLPANSGTGSGQRTKLDPTWIVARMRFWTLYAGRQIRAGADDPRRAAMLRDTHTSK